MDPAIFRAYDVRGVYPRQVNGDVAYALGLAFGRMVGGGKVLVGRDVRLSGPELARYLSLGLEDAGLRVFDAGVVPTPALYIGVVEGGFDGGVQVTASHNPPDWNGFKFVTGTGETISQGMGMEELRDAAMSLANVRVPSRDPGTERVDVLGRYLERLKSLVRLKRKLKVAVDFSNGAGAVVGVRLLREIGVELHPLNDVPDGRFPAHLPEPTPETTEELRKTVREQGLDLGAALDGDADRAVFCDDRGRLLEGDLSLAVLVSALGVRGKVVYDVSCSSVVEEVIRSKGCEPVLCRVGRAFMLRKVREVGAVIGAEKSNHLYFSEIHGFDDGLFAVAKMAEAVSGMERPLSEFIDSLPKRYASTIFSVNLPNDEVKWKAMEVIARKLSSIAKETLTIDGVKAYLDDGWVLIRPSNTMPQIKYTAESVTEEGLRRLLAIAEKTIAESVSQLR
ncbi:MAG: phosphomannomutase/phosphoglucomutase [Nitrososphaerota archaeon]